ncbi:hypothetical protein [Bacillus cihuensis]|uniref:hypothetical protein n=1 Tax=Bacillus cihuensis TaxID=1208599 RepID=UPI0003FE635C|nr:hypothetical protein [Bacillus cihuensis]
MSKNLNEDEIKQTMLENTEYDSKEKEEIWNKIESEIKQSDRNNKKQVMKKRYAILMTAAAAVFLLFGTETGTGYALIDKVKQLFVPEKKVPLSIEGTEEETDVTLKESADYVIYVDEEHYRYEEKEGYDLIVPKVDLPERYPEVSMEIRQISDKKPDEVLKDVQDELRKSFPELKEPEKVTTPLKGWMLKGITGVEWDSPVTKTYIISNGQAGSFVIKQTYFLEASEGHAVRFDNMLKEFKLIPKE